MVKPVWVWLEENFGDSLPSGFFGCELRESFLKVTCAVPASSFVPDLVTTLTKPDMERPNSAFAPLLHDGGEARQLRLDLVRSERQQHGPEAPGAVGYGDALVVRGGVLHGDGDARHGAPLGIDDGALDRTGGGVGLREERRGNHEEDEDEKCERATH